MSHPIVDRRIPTDWKHVEKYPGRALRAIAKTVDTVEVTKLPLPKAMHPYYDQGKEGACIGYGMSICMSILNRKRYDAFWLYRQAQFRDDWADTPPEGGTSLRAGFDVLRDLGHREFLAGKSRHANIVEGIVGVNRWLTTVDEVRTAIAQGMPVVLGVNWFSGLYSTTTKRVTANRVEHWAPGEKQWGRLVGGHCICAPLASDKRQAIGWLNSWGTSYAWPVWVPYTALDRLLREDGEAAVVVDR
jgi:hypothetical protein